jgi:hypothetical protein
MRVNRIPEDTMTDKETVGRFSVGMERLGPYPDKARAGRFSTAIERLGASAGKDDIGRFSVGMEHDGSGDQPRSSMPDAA